MAHTQSGNTPTRDDRLVTVDTPDSQPRDRRESAGGDERSNQHQERRAADYEQRLRPARTSTAATFGLIFGLTALLATLTVILVPLGIVLSIVGLFLGVLGFRHARRPGITGRTIAISGTLLSIVALILGIVLVSGAITALNNERAVNWMENQVQDLRNNLPTQSEVN